MSRQTREPFNGPLAVKLMDAAKDPSSAYHRFRRGNFVHSAQDLLRIFSGHHKKTGIVNQQEIRVIGLRRTGNHAIIQWIEKQASGVKLVLNNLPVRESPYRHRHEYPERLDPPGLAKKLLPESKGKFSYKDCLIYSYEDHRLQDIADPQFEEKHDFYLGKSLQRYDVLILRDPFNLVASRLKSGKISVKDPAMDMVQLWVEYAKEFLGETQLLKHNKICLNYNLWFADIDYRKELAKRLGLEFSDAGKEVISRYGGGSSFDGNSFQGQADSMDVNKRWKHFINDRTYQKYFETEALFDYSERIFGYFSETERLRSIKSIKID